MKVKDSFILRNIAGNNVVLPMGASSESFSGMMTLNETGVCGNSARRRSAGRMKQIVDMKKLEPSIREIVGAGGNVRLTVTGKSMMPTLIEHRDSVILEKPDKLKKSDIVLYQRSNGDYVLHRIVKIKKDGLGMCGDNQMVVEFPILPEQVIAVVSAIVRKGRRIEKTAFGYRFSAFLWTNLIPMRPMIYKTAMKIRARFK